MKFYSYFMWLIKTAFKNIKLFSIGTNSSFRWRRIEGEILRNVHSIEKGLSLEDVRLGFGYEKIMEAFGLVDSYINNANPDCNMMVVQMFANAVNSYIKFHNDNNYSSEKFNIIKANSNRINELLNFSGYEYGGCNTINRVNYTQEEREVIKRLFYGRHSVREFSKSSVNDEMLRKSIVMAMQCPSACNRQGYRVYIVDHTKFDKLKGWFDGVGGFAHQLDKILLITGVVSAYRLDERYLYAVTSSVFASYLTLSLEANNIGCCFIQRDITPSYKWKEISTSLNIPRDELPVCALGIGCFKETYKAPVSNRLPFDNIVKYV